MRVGQGLDVHALVEGRKLVIGGVDIPFHLGLEGHSDADVLLHAICDALLGAAVGCLVGALMFVTAAAFRDSYARAVRATFAHPNPWLLAAGVLSSFGQIFYFAALNENPMARVALVSSIEVFITLFLGAVFLRKSESVTPPLVLAAVLGFAGTAAVIAF